MDLRLTEDQRRLREQVRRWLADVLPWGPNKAAPEPPAFADLADEVAFLRLWQSRLAAAGFVGAQWPRDYGGQGLGAVEAMIIDEELALARFPELVGRIGVNLVGPTLLQHGTADQNARWLPHILRADQLWCQLFSEPQAGSDLRSLRTRAVRTDTGWSLSGQKIWTSYAQFTDWGLCLARAAEHETAGRSGITAFVVDMRSSGVTVRPLVQLTGESEFNEVFLDDVAVPDEHVIGQVGDGWRVATSTLVRERGLNPRQLVIHLQHLDAMVQLAGRNGGLDDPATRQALGQAYVAVHIFRVHTLRLAAAIANGVPIGPEGSAVKLHWSEASKRMHRSALDMLGSEATVARLPGEDQGGTDWQRSWLYYLGSSIWAGTNEMQRNIVSERVLQLPRERRGAGSHETSKRVGT